MICYGPYIIPLVGKLCEVIATVIGPVGTAVVDKLAALNEGLVVIPTGTALCFPLEMGGAGNVPVRADEDLE